MLDPDVLDVHPRLPGDLEKPGKLARPVLDDHLHHRLSPGGLASRAAIAAATTCGAWETSATQRSCSAAVAVTGSAPQARASAVTAVTAPGRVSWTGHSTQGRPRNRSALAAAGPERSRPE